MKPEALSIVLILTMLAIFLGTCNGLTELEGTWVGCEVRKPLIDWTLTIKANRFYLVREDSNRWYKGFLRLNKNCRLKKIDLEISDTPGLASNGKTSLGIYEIDGDTLTLVSSEPGSHSRPLSFDEPGKSTVYIFAKN